jgi:UDP-N-acetylmuramate: L-alanyl-gamma-D-glutamyl-meso-diaminopimelate ligase
MELRGEIRGVCVYDDFAHHPTAIKSTLHGLRAQVGEGRILAILEPRSNTMRRGIHAMQLPASLSAADHTWVYAPEDLDWNAVSVLSPLGEKVTVVSVVQEIIDGVSAIARRGDQVLIMSNGGFEGIHDRLLAALGEEVAHA